MNVKNKPRNQRTVINMYLQLEQLRWVFSGFGARKSLCMLEFVRRLIGVCSQEPL